MIKEETPLMVAHERGFLSGAYRTISCVDCTISSGSCQGADILEPDFNSLENETNPNFLDFSEQKEFEKKFVPKKQNNILLADSYLRIGKTNKSRRVSDCGTYLEFAHAISADGSISSEGKLHLANFCKDRLCPLCAWRRSRKIFGQVSQIMDCIGKDYRFLFLTLTVVNCSADALSETIDGLMSAWDKFCHMKQFKRSVRGFCRILEVTRNKKDGTFHPHFHVVLAVPPDYFSHYYVLHNVWLGMWRVATGDSSITQVNIQSCKSRKPLNDDLDVFQSMATTVAEIAKYAVKDSDYIFASDPALTDRIVSCLSDSLFRRRLIAYGGCFRDAYKRLSLDDPEDGDLIHVDHEPLRDDLSYLIVRYGWASGVYKILDSYTK